MLGGVVGDAIGSAVGYFANSLLYGSILKTFEDAELSRKQYETMHVFYEYYIDEMKCQRQELEQKKTPQSDAERFLLFLFLLVEEFNTCNFIAIFDEFFKALN